MKPQVVKIKEEDAKDSVAMLVEHRLGETDKETTNAKYVAKLLTDDFGFLSYRDDEFEQG